MNKFNKSDLSNCMDYSNIISKSETISNNETNIKNILLNFKLGNGITENNIYISSGEYINKETLEFDSDLLEKAINEIEYDINDTSDIITEIINKILEINDRISQNNKKMEETKIVYDHDSNGKVVGHHEEPVYNVEALNNENTLLANDIKVLEHAKNEYRKDLVQKKYLFNDMNNVKSTYEAKKSELETAYLNDETLPNLNCSIEDVLRLKDTNASEYRRLVEAIYEKASSKEYSELTDVEKYATLLYYKNLKHQCDLIYSKDEITDDDRKKIAEFLNYEVKLSSTGFLDENKIYYDKYNHEIFVTISTKEEIDKLKNEYYVNGLWSKEKGHAQDFYTCYSSIKGEIIKLDLIAHEKNAMNYMLKEWNVKHYYEKFNNLSEKILNTINNTVDSIIITDTFYSIYADNESSSTGYNLFIDDKTHLIVYKVNLFRTMTQFDIAFYHEIGHAYDYSLGIESAKKSAELKQLAEKYQKYLRNEAGYFKTDKLGLGKVIERQVTYDEEEIKPYEVFAEIFYLYMDDQKKLKAYAPEMFSFMDQIINGK